MPAQSIVMIETVEVGYRGIAVTSCGICRRPRESQQRGCAEHLTAELHPETGLDRAPQIMR
jgi:hypothetical protein